MNEIEKVLSESKFTQHGHLPAVAAYCRSLGLIEMVNEMAPTKMLINTGEVVQVMVLDTLSGRSPLYRLNEFMESQDIELLLGRDIPAAAFSDSNIGRSMDVLHKAGPSKIIELIEHPSVIVFAN